jgi:hypothetical protein
MLSDAVESTYNVKINMLKAAMREKIDYKHLQ